MNADEALAVLESLPRTELVPYLSRLEALLGDGGSSGGQPSGRPRPSRAMQLVFDDQNLMTHVLHFTGFLGFKAVYFGQLVGYQEPKPYQSGDAFWPKDFRSDTRKAATLMRLNKTCCSLITGEKGMGVIQEDILKEAKLIVGIARDTMHDTSVSCLARLFAVAMAEDTKELQRILDESSQDGSDFKNAARIYGEMDEHGRCCDELQLPENHPFKEGHVIFQDEYRECPEQSLLLELADNAAVVGANKSLEVLVQHEPNLHSYSNFDQRSYFFHEMMERICQWPYMRWGAESIEALFKDQRIPAEIQTRHYGSVGNSLHWAAAKGDLLLVQALLDKGYDPSLRCETKLFAGERRQRGTRDLPLAEDWARARGHTETASLLETTRLRLRPDLTATVFGGARIYTGKLVRFFPQNGRQYGFILPDRGQNDIQDFEVFVHIRVLRQGANQRTGFPKTGLRVSFTTNQDARGRFQASHVLDAHDRHYISLPLSQSEATGVWERYVDYESTEEEDDDLDDYDYVNDPYEYPTREYRYADDYDDYGDDYAQGPAYMMEGDDYDYYYDDGRY